MNTFSLNKMKAAWNKFADDLLGQESKDPNTFMQLLAQYNAAPGVEVFENVPTVSQRLDMIVAKIKKFFDGNDNNPMNTFGGAANQGAA